MWICVFQVQGVPFSKIISVNAQPGNDRCDIRKFTKILLRDRLLSHNLLFPEKKKSTYIFLTTQVRSLKTSSRVTQESLGVDGTQALQFVVVVVWANVYYVGSRPCEAVKCRLTKLCSGSFWPHQHANNSWDGFSVTSSGFPENIIFIPTNTDYILPYHKQVGFQAEASRPQGFSSVAFGGEKKN